LWDHLHASCPQVGVSTSKIISLIIWASRVLWENSRFVQGHSWAAERKIGQYATVTVLVEEIGWLKDILHIKISSVWQWWKF
jgi:hypothetical protein